MIYLRPSLVDTQLVHKEKSDDVFIKDFRPMLPSAVTLELGRVEKLPTYTQQALDEIYENCKSSTYNATTLLFKGLSIEVSIEAYIKAPSKIKKIFNEKYLYLGDRYVINRSCIVSEAEHDCIMEFHKMKPLTESERQIAAKGLTTLGIETSGQELVFTAHNNISHSYFYAKKHEHVPGIMLMEMARQAFYAYFYLRSGHKRENVNLSILDFNCKFTQFCESFHPLRIHVESPIWEIETVKKGHGMARLRATFHQNRCEIAVIEMDGQMSPPHVFSRMRRFKPKIGQVFTPLQDSTRATLCIIGSGNYPKAIQQINHLSIDGAYHGPIDENIFDTCDRNIKFALMLGHDEIITGIGRYDSEKQYLIREKRHTKFVFEDVKEEDFNLLSSFFKWKCCSIEENISTSRTRHIEKKRETERGANEYCAPAL